MKKMGVSALQGVGILLLLAVISAIVVVTVESINTSKMSREARERERVHPNPNWTEFDRYLANQAGPAASSPTPAK